MQAGGVLGKTSLGSMNKGQHFIWTRGLHFPDILELCVLHKSRFIWKLSPQSFLDSLVWVWIEYFLFPVFFCSAILPRNVLEGQSNYSSPGNPYGLRHFQEFPLSYRIQLFFLQYVLVGQLSLWVWVLILLVRNICWCLEEQICIPCLISASGRGYPLIFQGVVFEVQLTGEKKMAYSSSTWGLKWSARYLSPSLLRFWEI